MPLCQKMNILKIFDVYKNFTFNAFTSPTNIIKITKYYVKLFTTKHTVFAIPSFNLPRYKNRKMNQFS